MGYPGMGSDIAQSVVGTMGVAADIWGQYAQRKTDRQNIDRQNKANMALAQYTYQKDLEMWNRANVYNSPAQQMERLKAAGLNPNLVYGNGAVGNTSSGSLPRFQAPNVNAKEPYPVNPLSAIEAYQDMALKQAQIDNVNAQRRVTESEGIIRAAKAKYAGPVQYTNAQMGFLRKNMMDIGNEFEMARLRTMFDYDPETGVWTEREPLRSSIQAEYDKNVQQLQKYQAEVALKNAQKDLNQLQLKYMRWGSPVWTPLINAAGGIGRSLMLK